MASSSEAADETTARTAATDTDKLTLSSQWMCKNEDFHFPFLSSLFSSSDDNDHDDQNGNNNNINNVSHKEDDDVDEKSGKEYHRRLDRLQQYWKKAIQTAFYSDEGCIYNMISKRISEEWFHNKIVKRYCETHRAYHTLVHLEEMIGYIEFLFDNEDTLIDLMKNKKNHVYPAAMILSTFFHDIVYDVAPPPTKPSNDNNNDTSSFSNEKKSANLFQEFCQEMKRRDGSCCNINPILESRIVSCILATEQHKPPPSEKDDDDTEKEISLLMIQYFLDIDMAVLGKESNAYNSYARLIRKEYEFVDRCILYQACRNITRFFTTTTEE